MVGVSPEAIPRGLGAWPVVGVVCGESHWGRELPPLPVCVFVSECVCVCVCVCVCESRWEIR